ncbi:hypothetical protein ACS0TY_021155 [Phlomoides rotata]
MWSTLTPSDIKLPFKFQRRQFPLMGQSLKNVGLLLKKPVFSHGQLYATISRVTKREGLKILTCDDNCESKKKRNGQCSL